jgi:hypothetical protein
MVNGMDNKATRLIGYVIEGTGDVKLAVRAIKYCGDALLPSGFSFDFEGVKIRYWFQDHYDNTHRFGSQNGWACPLGRGRVG